MKTLGQHIKDNESSFISLNEKLVINKGFERNDYFVYKIDETKSIEIFDNSWPQFDKYKDKVYVNGEHVELNDNGSTCKKYSPGEYKIKIKDIDFVENCYHMFWKCPNLITVPLFDTRNVKSMGGMFYYCFNLTEVPLFYTMKVEDMGQMFFGCKRLEKVPLFDTRKVTNMYGVFCKCDNLTEVPLFDTSKVEIMNLMFYKCDNLNEKTKREWSKIYDFYKDDKK